jgi:antitoxin HicB
MKTYTYRAVIEPGDERDWVVSFPDVPEAITQADTVSHARHAAQDALGVALLSYPARGRALPANTFGLQSPIGQDADARLVDVAAAPDVIAKLAVLDAFASSGQTADDLAGLLHIDATTMESILDPMHPTDLPLLADALEALGQRFIVGIGPANEAA